MTVADYGVLIRRDERAILEYRRRYDHPPERVRRALTEPGELAAWFPTTIDGERAPGAALSFRFEQLEIDPFDGEMVAFEPPSLLELSLGPRPAALRAGARRRRDDDDVHGRAGGSLGKATRDGAGWHQSLEGLKRVLAGAPARPGTHDAGEWRSLRDAYAERFGPEASVLGPPQEWQDEFGAV